MLNNTASKNIQFFKSFLIWANINNYCDNNSYKSFRGKSEKNEVIYLTENELMNLYNFDTTDDRLKRVRDLFVFQCFTGVRYSDIQNISKEDINNATWTVRTQKTHQIIEIPLNAYAISILAKYSEFPRPLPVISNQKMNDYLKELCEKAGINDLVTDLLPAEIKKAVAMGISLERRVSHGQAAPALRRCRALPN